MGASCAARSATAAATLVLIGDPKQAIYAFRGADVYAYLDAAATAGDARDARRQLAQRPGRCSTPTTRCSAARGSATRGSSTGTVRAADGEPGAAADGAPAARRCACASSHRDEPSSAHPRAGYAQTSTRAREHIAQDLAADLVRLLSSGAEIEARAGDASGPATSRCSCARNRDAGAGPRRARRRRRPGGHQRRRQRVRHRPRRATGCGCCEALERPTSPPRARAAALTAFLGWSAERVAAAGEEEWEDVHRAAAPLGARAARARASRRWPRRSRSPRACPSACCARVDGERRLTDLRHVGQLLHAAATAEQLGADRADAWLRRRIAEAGRTTGDEERSRRLESDAEAVQVLTDPPQQGPRVPGRLLPVPVGPVAGSRDGRAGRLPRPRRAATGGRSTSGSTGRTTTRHTRQHAGRAARRGPAARVRRAHPRAAPGGRVVGGGRGTAATRRSAGCCSRATPDGTVPATARDTPTRRRRVGALRGARRARRPAASRVERVRRSACRSPWRGRRPRAAPSSRPRASTARSTGAGGARPTATSRPARTRRGVASEPEEDGRRRRAATAAARRGGAGAPRRRCAPCRRCCRRCRRACSVGTFVHAVLEAADFAAPRPRRRARRAAAAVAGAAAGRRRRRGRRSSPGCARRSRRRSARSAGGVRLRDVAPRRPARRARLRAAAGRRRRADRPARRSRPIGAVLRDAPRPATRCRLRRAARRPRAAPAACAAT